ncbi:DUF5610 domain-containing protein [Gilvimarinus sp. DA14]|uniref:DUF5610 domain-containing protein n=1 Tax=Gilvimarinus sp. DA14 TaxID=2956798 RepID=UPI0020B79C30|nr:DUF5610 domain-containing protein [Gilvimarinus sp. DA14]UTF60954.1 DUF5610 domain-containing protein [Gilvimarinus sp. DA14]
MFTKQTSDILPTAQNALSANTPRHFTLLSERALAYVESSEPQPKGFKPLTAEQAAGNILGFIERQLQRDVADGASESELQSRLQAGLQGFKKGFAEAEERLSALNMLNERVQADIGKTYDLVTSGVDKLAEQYTPNASTKVALSQAAKEMSAPLAASYDYAGAQSFQFVVRTREGDTITVAAQSATGASASFRSADNAAEFAYAEVSSSRYSLTIEGELSEQERQSLADLLDKVDHLAEEFFTGNLDSAFSYAQNLGYDSNQISGFALRLTQVEYQRVGASYGEGATSGLAEQLEPVGRFIKDTQQALDKASVFAEPIDVLQSIIDAMYLPQDEQPDPKGRRFADFVRDLLAQPAVVGEAGESGVNTEL